MKEQTEILSFNSPLSTKGFNTEVYDQINRFLKGYERESKNTLIAYERDIRQFFRKVKNKDIEHLTKDELKFTIEEFEDYQSFLIDGLGLSHSTSNRKTTSISECFRHLYRRGLVNNINFLDIKKPAAVSESYDVMTMREVEESAYYMRNISGSREKTRENGRMLILFSFDTCMRLEECLNLTWNNFFIKDDFVQVRTVAKGNKVMTRRITHETYNELLELKEEGKNKVFSISKKTVERMMNDIREHLDISENRNIVFHSIRKAGAQYLYAKFRDINMVSKALGHASIKTTEIYINKDEDYGILGGYSSMNETNENLYKEVNYKELIKAIGSLGKDKQMYINLKLEEQLTNK